MIFTLLLIIAYLLGSLSSAIIVSKLMGLPDPRTQGSKNPGATNMLRLGGKKLAAIVLLGDALKGFIPVLFSKMFGIEHAALACIALAAFLGHLYPIFFQFKGGKGVATAFGGIMALAWPVGLALIITWLVTAGLFRYSSLAALITAGLAPFYIYAWSDPHYLLPIIIMVALLFIRHHGNIKNLYRGKEQKIKR